MPFRISIGPRDSATVIVTETAQEAVNLITSTASDGHALSVQTLDGDDISLGQLISLLSLAAETDEAGVAGASLS